jgi:hypothetical protein
MGSPPAPTPVAYPVNDTSRSEAERAYLQQLTDFAAKQDLTQDLREYVRNVTIAFTVFAGVFVALRFLARYRQAARVGLDDWLMVAAFAVLIGNMAMNLVLIQMGLGLHSGALALPELQKLNEVRKSTTWGEGWSVPCWLTLSQTLVPAEIIYVTGVNLYKLSLLCFYFRVFPVRSVRLGGYICGGISTAWNIACILAATWQCTPRERLWMPWLDGTCINLFLTQLCISVPSILCDIAILCLPLPHVMRLKTNRLQRILLLFIFLLGSYVVFTSIYRFRIYLDYTTDDVPWSLADPCAWNIIEISSGIVSACLPTLVSLFVAFPYYVVANSESSRAPSSAISGNQPGCQPRAAAPKAPSPSQREKGAPPSSPSAGRVAAARPTAATPSTPKARAGTGWLRRTTSRHTRATTWSWCPSMPPATSTSRSMRARLEMEAADGPGGGGAMRSGMLSGT